MRVTVWAAFLVLSLATITVPNSLFAQAPPERVLILFDRSGSMKEPLDGIRKIDMGRTLFAELANEFEGSEHVAVRFFAGGQAASTEENCQASSLVLPFGGRTEGALDALSTELWAEGRKTPLAHAIALAHEDLAGWTGPRRIILISDGEDTCGEDPEPQVEEMAATNTKFDVIGLGDAEDMAGLAGLGLADGASFSLASNYSEFADALGASAPGMPSLPPTPGGFPAAGAGAGAGSGAGSGGGAGAGSGGAGAGSGGAGTGGSGSGGGAVGSGAGGGSRGAAGRADAGSLPSAAAGSSAGPPLAEPPLTPLPPDQPLKVEIKLPPDESEEPDPVAVELILDVSGSMAAWIDGKPKMQQALAALQKSIGTLDAPHVTVGLRAYGFDTSVEKTPEASCPNTELIVPFAAGQTAQILEQANSLNPYGYTPIADSVIAAGQDLAAYTDRRRAIILITDGEETCEGDPVAAIKALADICVDTNVHIVGFDLDPKAKAEMQANAAAGCGLYIDAPTAPELETAMIEITEVVTDEIDLDWSRFVNPVTGGATIEDAVTLTEGAYTFQTHLDKGEEQFFYVPLEKAQRLRMIVTAQGRLVSLDESGKLVERKGFDFTNFWADFRQADGESITGPYRRISFRSAEPGTQEEAQLLDMTGEGVYIHVRANAMQINKDTRFDLFIDDAGDIMAAHEAPEDTGPDIEVIEFYQSVVGHIGLQDKTDSFEISGIPEGAQEIGVIVNFTDPDFRYRVLVKNLDTNRTVKRYNGLTGRQALFFDVPPDGADLMLQITSQMPGNKVFSSYTFVVED